MKKKTQALVAAMLSAAFGTAGAQTLPDTMTWSSYDVGSAGYAEASAIADAFGREYGTRVRIQPSGSAVGRLQPLLQGRVDYGYLATETFFATEGVFDFASRRWGPQDLRVVAGRPSSFGMPTAADADIDTVADVAGKRVAYVAGNPSINVKCDAVLAFAGLDRDDVDLRMFPTYGAAMSSLAQGQADATCTLTTPSQMYELAESPRGIHWVPLPPDNEQGWQRLQALAPFFAPFEETVGAGISEDEPVPMMAYRYPMIVVRADQSEEAVYNYIKALDETFDLYNDATASMPRWDLERAGHPPVDAPFHPGAIKYLEEQGIWTEADQAWNDRRLKRLEALRAAWKDALAANEDADDQAFAEAWAEARRNTIAALESGDDDNE
ncbi:C4-dicarboxylate ABC transporter substrate-binding protein [Salinisphaera orenii MK-B5]|uniref:C4-dicarboxylate ABC transporter substrate-binding protein n=1 Tax=Salinisphaera orenii MK-B5 TaxID=856730 RepID=A0A423PFU4_9GAMM|nr:TAXI family TRAP transporter solute-binding subunit [Salinisphaera orenii]ROO24501.1 C4-dicarboxylate ABC transporter substrate-binding protein [Salinisphaera orenii MK-B5]